MSSGHAGRLLPAGQVAGQHVDLQIDPRRRPRAAERGHLPGVRDDVDAEDVALDLVDGQRHAVDGDRALGRDEAMQRRGRADRAGGASRPPASTDSTSPTPSTWPETMWPPSSSPTRAARSRLIRRPSRQSPRVARVQGLAGDLDREPAVALVDHGQAAAGVADRGADVDARQVVGGLDLEAAVAVGVAHARARGRCR